MRYPTLQELLEAGVHFGHKVSRTHPRMRPFIYGARDGVSIIDLIKTEESLKEALNFVKRLGAEGKVLLFVATKKQAKGIVSELANKVGAPYLCERWVGGFLTNFEEISKNIKILKELKDKKEKGELKKYTKKEQLLIDRKVAKLEKDYAGVLNLETVPDGLFIIDVVREDTAVREAQRKQVLTVAIVDSNGDPTSVDFPIPGNDDAIKSINILAEAVAKAYEEGKKSQAIKVSQDKDEKAAKESKKEEGVDEELKIEVAVAEEMVEKEAVKDAEKVV